MIAAVERDKQKEQEQRWFSCYSGEISSRSPSRSGSAVTAVAVRVGTNKRVTVLYIMSYFCLICDQQSSRE